MINDNGTFEVRIGQQTRRLKFRTQGIALLEERLGSDPFRFLSSGGGQTKFVAESLFCGLVSAAETPKERRDITMTTVYKWLDNADADDFSFEDFSRKVLYAVARSKPESEAKALVAVLDEAYGVAKEEAEKLNGPLAKP